APNRIETARLLSQMTGDTTVRHAHRTVSSSGASISEPEVARPLITPDEAMRLGGNEALIFTSGRPTIRARKLRYYNDPFFRHRATTSPPPSDRIALPSPTHAAIAASVPPVADSPEASATASDESKTRPGAPRAKPAVRPPTGQPRQLSLLGFALKDQSNPPETEDQQERLL
ncbi:MAG: type IV secretory system conjugative DNA transfer family protein, partial [Stellaceae bacterium]